ncbi:MAG: beta-galactosidase [Acidobacteria bacterium]|nr:beta-galactosidase [Acidobacteriota bacterium]
MNRLHRCALLAMSLSIARAQSASPDLRGIYVYTNDVAQVSASTSKALISSIALPGVDGVALVVGWNAVEPSMGQYQWTVLDQWISRIAAVGKKIDLVVPAGDATPSWLFDPAPAGAGAGALRFTISPHGGATGACQTETIAAPWDPAFLSHWDALLAALAAHLKSAGAYDAITLVRLTGINRTTEELRLPAETPQSTGLACVSDAVTTWQQAGYKPSLLLQAWTQIIGSFQKSFPDKTFDVSVIPLNPFPAIAEDGSVIKGAVPDQNQPLFAVASQKLPGRLVVQFDFLMPGEPASTEVVQAARTFGTLVAFQTNEYFGSTGQGAACSEPVTSPTPCTSTTYLEMLETGIYPLSRNDSLRAQFIEIFHANASAFPDDVLQAHFELAPPVISLVANAEGESPAIAPNTWVEVKGAGLALTGDSRIWQSSDFSGSEMPAQLDGVGVTVNGKAAYVYYISPSQVNILTPPDAMSGPVQVSVTNKGTVSAPSVVQALPLSPSFFVFNGGPYLAAVHADGSLIGPTNLYAGLTTPAKPGETVLLYANGFGPTSAPIVSGSLMQSGTLSPVPVVKIGGANAAVQFAGLVAPGEFQFNVVIPSSVGNGDQPITASYSGISTQPGVVIAVHN